MDNVIDGLTITPLKIIKGLTGDVLHGLKNTDPQFAGFGEAYFSTVHHRAVKGWKKHREMTLNLIVVTGRIRFVIYDDRKESSTFRKYQDVVLSPRDNYCRLTVRPGLWMAFEGMDEGENVLLNLASIPHNPDESINSPVESGLISFPTLPS